MLERENIELRKTRDFGEKFNASFEFLKQEFKPLMTGIIYIAGPFIAIAGVLGAYYQKYSLSLFNFSVQSPEELFTDDLIVSAIAFVLSSMIAYLLVFAVVNEYAKAYSQGGNLSVDVSTLWPNVRDNLIKYIVSGIGYLILLMFFSVIAGFVLGGVFLLDLMLLNVLIFLAMIPAILMVAVLWYFVYITHNNGSTDFFGSIGKTINILKGNWWSSLGLIIVASILVSILNTIFTIPNLILTSADVLHSIESEEAINQSTSEEFIYGLTSFIGNVSGFFLSVIMILIMLFQFYNLMEKTDATGLMGRIESMGQGKTNDDDEDF